MDDFPKGMNEMKLKWTLIHSSTQTSSQYALVVNGLATGFAGSHVDNNVERKLYGNKCEFASEMKLRSRRLGMRDKAVPEGLKTGPFHGQIFCISRDGWRL